jgi:dolichyl-diphosphooligosaccharide--protein glycosyltransferase
MSKTKDNLENVEENKKTFFQKYKLYIIILLIFILAFSIRAHLIKYDYMFEFDPYWHVRATSYVLQDGEVPDVDPLGFYAQGGRSYKNNPPLLWYLTAALYKLFTFGAAYDKWLLLSFARYLPAIFGALISVAMFFLGKEIYNEKAGIVMGVISASIPAFVYRTMAGFFEEDALGFLWLVIGMIFLVKAIKHIHANKKHLTYAVISAIFFSLMAMTWAMFLIVPLILVFYFICNIVYMALKGESNTKIAKFIKILVIVGVLFTSISSLFVGTEWINRTTKYVSDYIPINQENIERMNKTNISETDVVGKTVGEENTGKQFFLVKYNLMIVLAFLTFILLPIYLLWPKLFGFKKDHKDHLSLIIFFWLAICFFMAWIKLKFTYTLGLPIAAAGGFLTYLCVNWLNSKQRSLITKRIFVIVVALFLITSIAAGSHFVSTKVPPIDEEQDWLSAFEWINNNTTKDIKIFNWWDQGHWITYFTERKASTDNTNAYIEGTSDFANFVITDDFNKVSALMKKYDPTIIAEDSSFFSKYNSFGLYAYITTNIQDPRISKYFGIALPCTAYKKSVSGDIIYDCRNLRFEEQKMNQLPTTWTSEPTDVYQGMPVYLYRDKDNSTVYFINSAINNSIFAKIWFEDKEYAKYFDIVYNQGDVKLIKVNKEKFK